MFHIYLGWNSGKMWKTKQINAPWADYKGNERSLSDEEYTDKDDGE